MISKTGVIEAKWDELMAAVRDLRDVRALDETYPRAHRLYVHTIASERLGVGIALYEAAVGSAPVALPVDVSHLPKPVCSKVMGEDVPPAGSSRPTRVFYCSMLAGHEGECSWDR